MRCCFCGDPTVTQICVQCGGRLLCGQSVGGIRVTERTHRDSERVLLDGGVTEIEIRGVGLPVDARLSREGLMKQVEPWVHRDLEVGDAGFDDRVWISTSTPHATRQMLAANEVRGAVLELLQWVGQVQVQPDSIRMELHRGTDQAEAMGPAQTCCLLGAQLARVLQEQTIGH